MRLRGDFPKIAGGETRNTNFSWHALSSSLEVHVATSQSSQLRGGPNSRRQKLSPRKTKFPVRHQFVFREKKPGKLRFSRHWREPRKTKNERRLEKRSFASRKTKFESRTKRNATQNATSRNFALSSGRSGERHESKTQQSTT